MKQTMTITYQDQIRDEARNVLAHRTMACDVEVTLDVDFAVKKLGITACKSKSGKSVDGPCTVRRVGVPKELSRQSV